MRNFFSDWYVREKHWPGLFYILTLLASSLLVYVVGYSRGIGTDGAFYALSGYNLFHGFGYTYSDVPNTFTWPLFSIFIGMINTVIPDLQLCAHIVLVLSFAFGTFPFYFGVRNLFGKPTAVIAGVLYCLNGFLLRLSARITPEPLMILMLLTSFYYTTKILKSIQSNEKTGTADYVRAGLFLGLAYLAKPEGFQYFVIVWVFLLLLAGFGKRIRREALALSLMALVFAAVVAPQLTFVHSVTGKWELTTYNRFLFRGWVEPLVSFSPGEASKDPKMEYNYNAYIVRGPYTDEQFERDITGLRTQFAEYSKSALTIIGPLSLILLAFHIFGKSGPADLAKRYVSLMLLPIGTLFFWYAIKDKFFIVSVPFFIIINAGFLASLKERFRGKAYIFYGLFVLIYLQSYTPISNQSPTNRVIGNHRQMGEWVRDNIPDIQGKLIADRKPYICFLAKARYFRYNSVKSYDDLIGMLRENHVDYLVVDDFYTIQKNPRVLELLDGKDRPELECVHTLEDSVYGRAILYKVR